MIKFTQIQVSMYGGVWALDQIGQLWHFNRYNEWELVRSPNLNEQNYEYMKPVPNTERKRSEVPGLTTTTGTPPL